MESPLPEDFNHEEWTEYTRSLSIASTGDKLLLALYFWKVRGDERPLNRLFEEADAFVNKYNMSSDSVTEDFDRQITSDWGYLNGAQNDIWQTAMEELGIDEGDLING